MPNRWSHLLNEVFSIAFILRRIAAIGEKALLHVGTGGQASAKQACEKHRWKQQVTLRHETTSQDRWCQLRTKGPAVE